MKYTTLNKPLVCMQTQSTCYKGTSTMRPLGALWHVTGVNNPNLSRYIQPSDIRPKEDTYSKEEWLKILGVNKNSNDWNHIKRNAGLNCWIGKLADGTVTTIQTMPWNYQPWGCGEGKKGSCNQRWMQFEICEDNLKDENYFNAVYKEACEITAYYFQMFGIDPLGTVQYNGVTVPTLLCHQDAYKLKLGSNHSDVYHWFKKYGKTMEDARNDVAALMNGGAVPVKPVTKAIKVTYKTFDDTKNVWLPDVTDDEDYAGIFGHPITGVYANLTSGDCVYKVHTNGDKWLPEVKNREDYAGILDKPIDGFMIKSLDDNVTIHYQVHIKDENWLDYVTGYDETDGDYGYAGIFGKSIDAIRMYTTSKVVESPIIVTPTKPKYYRVRKSWLNVTSQVGAYTSKENAIEACQKSGEGYKVFDSTGKEVYRYTVPKVEESITEVEAPKVEIEVPKTEEPKVEVPTVEESTNNEKEESTLHEPEVNSPDEDCSLEEDTEIDTEKVNSILDILTKILNFILDLFKKK